MKIHFNSAYSGYLAEVISICVFKSVKNKYVDDNWQWLDEMNRIYISIKDNVKNNYFEITDNYAQILARVIKENIFDEIRADTDEDMDKISVLIDIYSQIKRFNGNYQSVNNSVNNREVDEQEIKRPTKEEAVLDKEEIDEIVNNATIEDEEIESPEYEDITCDDDFDLI